MILSSHAWCILDHLIEALSGQGMTDEGARPISIADIYNYIKDKMDLPGTQQIQYEYENPDLASTIIASYGKSDENIKKTLRDVSDKLEKYDSNNQDLGSLLIYAKDLHKLMGLDYRDIMNPDQKGQVTIASRIT